MSQEISCAQPEPVRELLTTFTDWARQVAAREDVPRGIRSAAAGLHDDGKRMLAKAAIQAHEGAQAAPAALLEAIDYVLNQAPCECTHKMRFELGEHMSGCYLFDLNIEYAKTAAAPAPQAAPENLPTKEHIRELAQEALDQIMEQAQVFASAWSLVGGPFDTGNALSDAEDAKAELRTMVRSLADLAAETVRPVQAPAPVADHIADASKLVPLQEVSLTRDTNGMCVVSVNGREAIRDNGEVISHYATPDWFSRIGTTQAPAVGAGHPSQCKWKGWCGGDNCPVSFEPASQPPVQGSQP